jgi:hypothetical protein
MMKVRKIWYTQPAASWQFPPSALNALDLREDRPAILAASAPAVPARVALPTAVDHLWT